MRQPAFTFEPFKKVAAERKLERKRGFTVNLKHGIITFPKSYIVDNGLDGKYLKWFIDVEKKALGWKILATESDLKELEDYIRIKSIPSNGIYQMSIKRVLNTFHFADTNVTFKDLEVQKYLSKSNFYNDGVLHYVQLENPVPCKKREKKNEQENNEAPL